MKVTRQRRDRRRSRARTVVAVTTALAVTGSGAAWASTALFGQNRVGTEYPDGLQVSGDQLVKPYGERLVTQLGKAIGSTVSPDGRFLAATSTDKSIVLQVFDLSTYKLVWAVGKGATANQTLSDRSVGQAGPTWSPDGKTLWLPQAAALTRFPVNADGSLGTPTRVALPKVGSASALPAQGAYSADGSTLYVPLNGQNTVVALDAATGAVKQTWTVGTAPRQVAVVADRLYVSNEGGRPAKAGETTINSYGTNVPADPVLGTATTGTLSIVDTTSTAVRSINVGLHPTSLHLTDSTLYVANTGSDTVSVVDTTRDVVVQTIATQPWASSQVGYEPDGLATTPDGRLLVTLGRANAVAVYRTGATAQEPVRLLGLLATDYFPTDVAVADGKVVVTNTRGIDARGPNLSYSFPRDPSTPTVSGHGTHSTTASLTRFALPSDDEVAAQTAAVFRQNGWGPSNTHVKQANGNRQAAVAVPKRLGDPSTIKHVFLLVKENRTYDQVFGDDPRGDGDASLAQFGQNVTPNQHALAKQFGLYDNAYDIGTNSAEGHNWVMQGDDPEYTESSAGEYLRSYDTEDDVLGHQRSGFLWTAVQAAGGTARNYGEFMAFENKPAGATWQQYYCATKQAEGGNNAALTDPAIRVDDRSPIPSLDAISDHDSPQFDEDIPDLYRYQVWKQEFEKNGPASLNMMWLSSDHTGGTPGPRAQVADNDLAVGKIVDTISHSPYWKDSAIFVVEDDSQNGADHVDGHRSPIQVISPWAQHGAVDSTFYSQVTMVRTIEQILGAQPLNQKVAAASPMFGAFTDKPELTPFTALPNQVPLTEGVTPPPACGTDAPGTSATASSAVPAARRPLAALWAAWAAAQRAQGATTQADLVSPELMNRYTWYQTHAWQTPYPGDSTLYAPSQVPGGYVPGTDGN